MTRDRCGAFPWWFVLWHVAINLWIAISYLRIPMFVRKMEIPLNGWVALFIVLCGVGHILAGALPFVWANYLLIAMWDSGTAIVSHCTAGRLRGMIVLHKENVEELQQAIKELRDSKSSDVIAGRLKLIADRIKAP